MSPGVDHSRSLSLHHGSRRIGSPRAPCVPCLPSPSFSLNSPVTSDVSLRTTWTRTSNHKPMGCVFTRSRVRLVSCLGRSDLQDRLNRKRRRSAAEPDLELRSPHRCGSILVLRPFRAFSPKIKHHFSGHAPSSSDSSTLCVLHQSETTKPQLLPRLLETLLCFYFSGVFQAGCLSLLLFIRS